MATRKKHVCIEEETLYKSLQEQTKAQKQLLDDCKRGSYKYGPENKSLLQLLEIIKEKNVNEVHNFIKLFPETGSRGIKITQSHVFEALWNLIFIFQKDNLKGEDEVRKFYKKLESMEKQTDDIEKILAETLVNESKKSGIADTFFEHKEKTHQNKCPKCGGQVEESKMEDHIEKCKVVDCVFKKGDTSQQKTVTIPSCNSSKPIDTSKIKKFLFSAKYFKKEKSVSRYDIQDIFLEAHDKISQFNIILLVKDKEALEVKMTKTEKQLKNRFSKILDINDLDVFYKSLLFDLNNSESIEELFKSFSTKRNKKLLIPRFHQEYFINFTIENLLKKNKKLIWGAVPRSGKSYMIGGLVSKLLNLKKTNPTFELNVKNVIIFLGAISETGKQFEDLFKEFDDFNDFNIINIQNESTKYKSIKTGDDQKNIILISQQQAWYDTGKGEKKTETESGIEGLLELFSRKDTIVFFDEIHQGSSAKSQAQMNVLNKYIFRKEGIIFPFIMVTATFAKPLKKYLSLGGQESKLIQWRYEDIQYMKNINKPGKYDELIEEIKRMEEAKNIVKHSEVLIKLFNEYESRGISKAHLSKQYLKYPNLTILSPNLENNSFIENEDESLSGKFVSHSKIDIEREVICSIFKSIEKGFVAENNVIKLLNYIKKQIYDKLLKGRLGFDVYGRKHTQLWFLPTICANNTITKVKSLISELKKLKAENPKNIELIKTKNTELSLEKEKSTNISIEKMTRFLTLLLMKDPDFRKNFCVLVIHSQDLKTKKRPMDEEPFYVSDKGGKIHHYSDLTVTTYTDLDNPDLPCVSTKCVGDTNLGRCIEKQEACAHAQDKNLIILTGMRLRLGISLPCVDIALHMDPLTSVDTIYQSMFRVLTERPGKETGYFIDLLSERLVNFIYEYDNYTNKSNKTIDLSSRKKRIIEKLFSFNLNGLNDLKENTTFGKVYGKLSANLNLDDDIKFYKRSMSLEEDSIKSMLSDLETTNTELFNKFYKGIKFLNIDYSKVTREQIEAFKRDLYERKPPSSRPKHEGNNDNGNNDNGNNDGNHNSSKKSKEETQEKKQIQMINYIKDIFSLVVLFEHEVLGIDEDDFTCDPVKVKELLLRDLSYEITETDLEKLCSENSKIVDCHITHIKNLKLDTDSLSKLNDDNKANLIEMINLYRLILTKFIEGLNEAEIGELFKLYCLIKDSIVHLKKNIDKQYDIHKMKCIVEPQKAGGKKKTKLEETSLVKNETVLETIRKYLSVREEEKKLFGEVFTPIELICEMLDKLPASVWSDPTLKWLDPANGIGNYPVVCYYKLMEGLKTVTGYEDEKTRSKHIIDKMLFMVELNPVNVKVCRKVFKMIDPNGDPNIYNKDFLLWSADEIKKGNKYDIIMGNPPYQLKKSGQKKSQAIWPNFVESSINCLKENGYLLFVHPVGWRNIDGDFKKVFNLIQERDLQHLTMRTFEDGAKTFGGSGTNFDYYCVKNTFTTNNKTKINDIDRNEIVLDLNNYNFIPSGKFDIFDKLIKGREKVSILYERSMYGTDKPNMSDVENETFKLKIVYTITQGKGIKFWYSNEKKGMFVPKVIWSNGLGTYPIIDSKGEYGLTQFSYGIQDIPENLEFIKNAMNDDKFIELMEYVKFTNNKYNYKIIGSFKKDFWKEFDYKTNHGHQLRKSERTKKASRVNANNANTTHTHTKKASIETPAKPVEKPPSTHANNASKKVSRVNANVNHTKKKASNKTPTAPPSASKPQSSVSGLETSRTATNTKKSKRCPRGEHKIPCKTGFKEYTHAVKSIKCCRKDM